MRRRKKLKEAGAGAQVNHAWASKDSEDSEDTEEAK